MRIQVPLILVVCLGWAPPLPMFGVEAAEPELEGCDQQASAREWLLVATDPARPYKEQISGYERAIQICPKDISLYEQLAQMLLAHYEFDAALRVIQQGLKSAPRDPGLELDRAAAVLLRGQAAAALAILKGLPPTAKSEYYIGLACRSLSDHRGAQQALRRAWELGYHDPFLLYALVEQDRILRESTWQSKDLQTLQQQFPHSPWPHMAAGDGLKARQLRREADAEYKKAQAIDPNLPFLNHRLGSLAYSRGDYASATNYFRKEIALNPTYPAPYVFLGVSLHRLGNNREALQYLQQGVALAPEAPLAYLNLAIVQIELSQLEPARLTLETAQKRFPDQYIFPAKLSRLLSRLGRPEDAKVQSALAEQLGRNREKKEQQLLGIE